MAKNEVQNLTQKQHSQKRISNIKPSSGGSNFFIKSSNTKNEPSELHSPGTSNFTKKEETQTSSIKKRSFDKKQYRFQKYSKKYKLQQWEEKRKKRLLHEYRQSLKNKHEPQLNVDQIYETYESEPPGLCPSKNIGVEENPGDLTNYTESEIPQYNKQKKTFLKPHQRYQQIKDENRTKTEEVQRKNEERELAIQKAKKERFHRNKKLSQKTKKGQPIMKYRMELLLEKIEKTLKE